MVEQDLSRKKMYPLAMKVYLPGTETVRSDHFLFLSFFPMTSDSETFLRKKKSVFISVPSQGHTLSSRGNIYSSFLELVRRLLWNGSSGSRHRISASEAYF